MAQVIPVQKQCQCCGRMKDTKKDFYPNYNEFMMYNKMSYCKECEKEIAQKIMDKNANFELGVRNICVFFNLPFLYEAMNGLKDEIDKTTKERNLDFVFQYLSVLKKLEIPESYWNDLTGNSFLGLDILKRSAPTSDGDIELLMGLEKDWGKQDFIEDYLFLEEHLSIYSKGEDLTPSMKQTMKYLCLAELEVFKLKNIKEDTSKAEKKVMDYYKVLKLDNFQFNENKTIGERTLEKYTAIEENYRPVEIADKMFAEDICGLKKEYRDMTRCIMNAKDDAQIFPDGFTL